jgi:hypothetical protein
MAAGTSRVKIWGGQMADRLGGAVLDRECAISMYRDFGAVVDHTNKTVRFKLFFPDNRLDSEQYSHEAGLPEIYAYKSSRWLMS